MSTNIKLPFLIGHRGTRAYAPENTCAAFQLAKVYGISWVELDVALTRDDELVVIHDETVDRTTNGTGHVADLLYSDINKLDAGGWFCLECQGEKIPRFVDVIDVLAACELGVNIEIKPTPGKTVETAQKTLSLLKSHWPDALPTPLISSFDWDALSIVAEEAPWLPIGMLFHEWDDSAYAVAERLNAWSLNLNANDATAARVAEIKARGYEVLCYTVNDAAFAKKLQSYGVTAVFTDYPDLLSK